MSEQDFANFLPSLPIFPLFRSKLVLVGLRNYFRSLSPTRLALLKRSVSFLRIGIRLRIDSRADSPDVLL